MKSDAILSDCEKYRYRLSRIWDSKVRPVTWILLNPSTADAITDDNTVKSCIRLARHHKAGGILIVNCYAWRATDPKALKRAGYPVGPENDRHLRDAAIAGHPVIVAWGNNAQPERAWQVKQLLRSAGVLPVCLGITASGQPKHPLYCKTDQPLIPFTTEK